MRHAANDVVLLQLLASGFRYVRHVVDAAYVLRVYPFCHLSSGECRQSCGFCHLLQLVERHAQQGFSDVCHFVCFLMAKLRKISVTNEKKHINAVCRTLAVPPAAPSGDCGMMSESAPSFPHIRPLCTLRSTTSTPREPFVRKPQAHPARIRAF